MASERKRARRRAWRARGREIVAAVAMAAHDGREVRRWRRWIDELESNRDVYLARDLRRARELARMGQVSDWLDIRANAFALIDPFDAGEHELVMIESASPTALAQWLSTRGRAQ